MATPTVPDELATVAAAMSRPDQGETACRAGGGLLLVHAQAGVALTVLTLAPGTARLALR